MTHSSILVLGDIVGFISDGKAAAVFLPIATALNEPRHSTHFKKHLTDEGEVKMKTPLFGASNSAHGLQSVS
jgi:hypothetical protein